MMLTQMMTLSPVFVLTFCSHFLSNNTYYTLVGWGLVVAVFAMLAAAAVEFKRLDLFHQGRVLPPSMVCILNQATLQ